MVAVIRAGGLGDVLLTLPAMCVLQGLRVLSTALVKTPRDEIAVVGYPAFWRAAGPLVDHALSIDDSRFAGLYSDEPTPELVEWLRRHSILVAWTARPLAAWVEKITPRLIQASPYPPPGVHAAAWLLDTLAPLRASRSLVEPAGGWLGFTPMDHALGQARLARLGLHNPAIVHPGAGAAWKRWPAASFARLAAALRERGHTVALVEGPADGEPVEAVLAQTGPLPVIRESDLRALAQMLAGARLFIGNDSGVTHLAAMAGAPAIALFGPTDPISWAPLGNARIVRRCRRMAARHGEIRVCQDPDCMVAIAVEEVLEVIDIDC